MTKEEQARFDEMMKQFEIDEQFVTRIQMFIEEVSEASFERGQHNMQETLS